MQASTDKVKRGENFDLVLMRQSCVVMLSEVCGHGGRAESRSGRPGESVLHAIEAARPKAQIVVWGDNGEPNARADYVRVVSKGKRGSWN